MGSFNFVWWCFSLQEKKIRNSIQKNYINKQKRAAKHKLRITKIEFTKERISRGNEVSKRTSWKPCLKVSKKSKKILDIKMVMFYWHTKFQVKKKNIYELWKKKNWAMNSGIYCLALFDTDFVFLNLVNGNVFELENFISQ